MLNAKRWKKNIGRSNVPELNQGKFTGNLFVYREKAWLLADVPFTQPKNCEWTMAHVGFRDSAGPSPASTLQTYSWKFEATKNGSICSHDNLMDVGWISVQARASIGCLDMFGLSDSATRCKNHETLAGSNLNLLPLSGGRSQKWDWHMPLLGCA